MLDLKKLPPLKEVIAAHGLSAQKALGQNFLLDQNITDKIVRLSGDLSGVNVFEVGPGPGGLTRSLLASDAAQIVAVEFDERAVAALQDLKKLSDGRLQVVHGDAMTHDLRDVAPGPRSIVANLPYNIATPLLVGWLEHIHENPDSYKSMTLMFQREVAERITAKKGEKAYGRLGILVQWLCDARIVYDLPPSAFTPPPKVSSSVVHFVPKPISGHKIRFEDMGKLTAAAFGQRRKMIRSSLKKYQKELNELGLDGTLRAENLDVEDFINLASAIKNGV